MKNKKVVIFCGGKGTRIRELNNIMPKPLIKLKGKSILNHIIEIYKKQGLKSFLILTGYKAKYFYDHKFPNNIDIKIFFTGVNSGTAQRLFKVKKLIKNDDFFLTYGDTIGNFSINKVKKIINKNFLVSMCTYSFLLNKGTVNIRNEKIFSFYEKNFLYNINAGFYFVKKEFFKYLSKKDVSFESDTLPRIARKKMLIRSQKLDKWMPIDNKKDFAFTQRFILD